MQQNTPIRIVLAMPGVGGEAPTPLVQALSEAGIETFTGPLDTIEQVVETAIDKNADAICLSSVQGEHNTLFARLFEMLQQRATREITVFGGGIIPVSDMAELKKLGVAEVFSPGTSLPAVARWVKENVRQAADAR
ncbi:cobalamin B12-binding domain-containing protein [Kitasatospora sp. NPDC052896]|uniref:cobalamin B12-binding domain-containing protein n=1 Tax=Kitasatospora sp. NPDC052896 TaxID=3364061 RepID=UPI0037C57319